MLTRKKNLFGLLTIFLIIQMSCVSNLPKQTVQHQKPDQQTVQYQRPNHLLTYSQVLATYPPGVDLCFTDIDLYKNPAGGFRISAPFGRYVEFRNGEYNIRCYGTKITVCDTLILEGRKFLPGSKLTLDKNANWIEISSWE